MAVLTVEGIQKSFSGVDVLRDISFSLEKGEALAIIGSSGSGKTTLLRCLNFLETPDKGVIRVGDQVIFDAEDPRSRSEQEIRQQRLHFGLVFQSFNLFPQYTCLLYTSQDGQSFIHVLPTDQVDDDLHLTGGDADIFRVRLGALIGVLLAGSRLFPGTGCHIV